jgi:hypothetical protein
MSMAFNRIIIAYLLIKGGSRALAEGRALLADCPQQGRESAQAPRVKELKSYNIYS